MHPHRILTVCNPRSGRIRKDSRLLNELRAQPQDRYREASSVEEFGEAISGFRVTEADTVCIFGGDGTVHGVLTELQAHVGSDPWPSVMVIPAGSTNMTARDVGSGGKLRPSVEAYRRLLAGPTAEPSTTLRAVLRIDSPGQRSLSGMFFGTGVVADGVRFFRSRLRDVGVTSEGVSAIAILKVLTGMLFGRARPDRTGIGRDGHAEEAHETSALLATTLDRLLLGSKPYWGLEEGPIRLTVIDHEARRLWARIGRLAHGRPGGALRPEHGYSSHNASRIEIGFDGPFVVDGELYEARSENGPVTLTADRTVRWVHAP